MDYLQPTFHSINFTLQCDMLSAQKAKRTSLAPSEQLHGRFCFACLASDKYGNKASL